MSAITKTAWSPYLRLGRPTLKVSSPIPKTEPSRPAKDPMLTASHLQIDQLASLPEDWDGHGSVKPNEHAVEIARRFLEDAFGNTSATVVWQSPYISASEDGEIVFEWWNGVRKLTIYVGVEQVTFLKSF
jgi:hypothetical protein